MLEQRPAEEHLHGWRKAEAWLHLSDQQRTSKRRLKAAEPRHNHPRADSAVDGYVPSKRFAGQLDGFVFKTGERGTGYTKMMYAGLPRGASCSQNCCLQQPISRLPVLRLLVRFAAFVRGRGETDFPMAEGVGVLRAGSAPSSACQTRLEHWTARQRGLLKSDGGLAKAFGPLIQPMATLGRHWNGRWFPDPRQT